MDKVLTLTCASASDYVIVTPKSPTPSVATAATELRDYIVRISGALLKIVNDDISPTEREIIVGYSNRCAGTDLAALGEDGFEIRTCGERLFIVGGNQRGTLYGVYTFLEEYLGCRFYTPDCEKIPENCSISLREIQCDRQIPVFISRDTNWLCYQSSPTAAKRKLNGHLLNAPEKYGGRYAYAEHFCHSFSPLCPPAVYFEEHPEYFSMGEDGKRNTFQLCLTNPDTLRICIDNIRKCLKAHPDARVMSVSQNDGGNPCMCENCRKIYEREGTYSGAIIEFLNKIGEALEAEFPHVVFDTLAYQYSREKPRHIKPRHNVIVRLCSIECCYNHPQAECSVICYKPEDSPVSSQTFFEDLQDWSQSCGNLFIWDYTTNFINYQSTFPNFRVLLKNARSYADNHVVGVFEQGNATPSGEFGELRPYLISKVLWNPYMTEEAYYAHMDDFLEGYYGPGGSCIRRYIDFFQDSVKGKHVSIYYKLTTNTRGYDVIEYPTVLRHREKPQGLTLEKILDYRSTDWTEYLFWYKDADCPVVREGIRLFDKAMELAENDTQRARISRSRCQIVYHDTYYQRVRQKYISYNISRILMDFFSENPGLSSEVMDQLLNTIPAYVEKEFYGRVLRDLNKKLYDTLKANSANSIRQCTTFLPRDQVYWDREPMDMTKLDTDEEAIG